MAFLNNQRLFEILTVWSYSTVFGLIRKRYRYWIKAKVAVLWPNGKFHGRQWEQSDRFHEYPDRVLKQHILVKSDSTQKTASSCPKKGPRSLRRRLLSCQDDLEADRKIFPSRFSHKIPTDRLKRLPIRQYIRKLISFFPVPIGETRIKSPDRKEKACWKSKDFWY